MDFYIIFNKFRETIFKDHSPQAGHMQLKLVS